MKNHDWPFVKACGIRNKEDATVALGNGANTIGLLLGLTHKAEDKITPQQGKEVADHVRKTFPDARITMVTHLLDPDQVKGIAQYIGAHAIQIHDDMTPENVGKLREEMKDVELMKAIHIEGAGVEAEKAVVEKAKLYAPSVDAFLTDSKSIDPDGQMRIGGTGKRHDKRVGQVLIEAFPDKRVIIAGGVNGDNARQVIKDFPGLAGIDANSGLENKDGYKDAGKIRAFAAAGHSIALGKTRDARNSAAFQSLAQKRFGGR